LFLTGLAAAEQYDPPSRVARLQLVGGQVSMQPGGVDDWVPAGLNRPLTTGDRLWADNDSRAELTIGSAALRIGNQSALSVVNLGDNIAQFELDQGTLSLWVRFLDRGETVEIDTPNIAFTVTRPGEYRIDVSPDDDRTWVQTRRGEGEAYGQEGSLIVQQGELFEFSNGQSGQYAISDASPRDEFEQWSADRERLVSQSASARYCAPGTIGYEALDDSGDWQPQPTYGAVWFPRVEAGWAPYRDGHWAWIEPWGWTWVDDAPWGFTPFHYGRWAFISNRWGWVPGPREVRPVYAPALVAWIGGSNFGVSIGVGGGVGWVPLGWHDPFIPSYHVSRDYATRVNISNTRVVNTTIINNYYSTTNVNVRNTTITNIRYENVRVQNAVTAVPTSALTSGRSVRQVAVPVQSSQITATASFASAPNVAPTRQTVLGGHAPAAAPARLVVPKQVVAKAPPPAPPPSFDKQQQMLQKQPGMPLAPEQRRTLQTTAPAPSVRERPAVVSVTKAAPPKAAGAPGAPPKLEKPATPPAPVAGAAPGGRREAPGTERPAAGGRPATAPEAGAPAERPAPSGRPERPGMGGRPATAPEGGTAERPAPAPGPGAPTGGRPERPGMGGRPATAPEGGGTAERPAPAPGPGAPTGGRPERPGMGGRPATAPEAGAPEERPAPSGRPERPGMGGRPATAPEAGAPEERQAPSGRPERPGMGGRPATAPEAGAPEERPAPSGRPERTMERPAPAERPAPSRPTPQAERPTPQAERPAPQAERPVARPPERQAAPSQEKKAAPSEEKKGQGKEKDQENKNER
jgi:hypothetical protein